LNVARLVEMLPSFLTSRLSNPYIALSIFVRYYADFVPRKTEVGSLYMVMQSYHKLILNEILDKKVV